MSTILIVDDDEDVLEIVKSMLSPHHTVIATSDPQEALTLLQAHPISLLLTDVRMPRLNGLSLVDQARLLHPELPVIVVSAFFDQVAEGMDDLARNLVHKYANCALSKPLSRQTVNAAVDSVLAAASADPAPKPATHPMHHRVH